jgi:hypothetical protein
MVQEATCSIYIQAPWAAGSHREEAAEEGTGKKPHREEAAAVSAKDRRRRDAVVTARK